MEPTDFERRVAQITELLSELGADVTWNDRIADPDNPTQLRQVDVTIRRDGEFTIIECRHHRRPQDVKWVEELFGRKISLQATQAIGVSSSGFTEGALKKAERLGVFLRTFSEIGDEEIASWGKRTEVTLEYASISNLKIYFVPDHKVPTEFTPKLATKAFRTTSLAFMASTAARDAARSELPCGPIVAKYSNVPGVFLGSVAIKEIFVCLVWGKVIETNTLPVVMQLSSNRTENSEIMESASGSRHAVAYSQKGTASFVIDIGTKPSLPNSVLTAAAINFGKPTVPHKVGLIGLEEKHSFLAEVQFEVLPRESAIYRELPRTYPFYSRALGDSGMPKGESMIVEISFIRGN